jgi:hypothetical protein
MARHIRRPCSVVRLVGREIGECFLAWRECLARWGHSDVSLDAFPIGRAGASICGELAGENYKGDPPLCWVVMPRPK